MTDQSRPLRSGFDPEKAGRKAECDGGGQVPGAKTPSRQQFAGTLTGEYIDHGEPPWRWYLMKDLTRKPEAYAQDSVWCESGSIYLVEEG